MIQSIINTRSSSKPLNDSVILSSSRIRHFDRWDIHEERASSSFLREGRALNDILKRRSSAPRSVVEKKPWLAWFMDLFLRT